MFDIGWPELLLVMVIALMVIGPKELPNAIRTVMSVVRKLRMAAREFQSGLDDIARESGMDDIKRQMDDIEYYDPGEALKSIADSDKDLLGLDDDPDLPKGDNAGNSILDSNADYMPPHDGPDDGPDDGAGQGSNDESEPSGRPGKPPSQATAPVAQDDPAPVKPAAGGTKS